MTILSALFGEVCVMVKKMIKNIIEFFTVRPRLNKCGLLMCLGYAFTGINYIVVSIIANIQECGLDRSDFGLGIFMLGMALLTYMDLRPGMHAISVAICVISVQFFFNIGLAITCWSWWVIILCAVEVVASIMIVRIKFGPRKRRKKRQ